MTVPIGYCTNVHAGVDLPATQAQLERYAVAVKRLFSPLEPMGVGLWLAASAARQLRDDTARRDFAAWLAEAGLIPYTLNGFPYGDFHKEIVKHDVYLPTWSHEERLAYTLDLIDIQDALLPPGMAGSISTLPIAWGHPAPGEEKLAAAAEALRQVATRLARLERDTGRLICLCLEPEPGCVLQRGDDVVRFFEERLLRGPGEEIARRYLRVCHDVCHAEVMFEDQADVLRRYREAGIAVGKVQVSSAVAVPFDRLPVEDRAAALEQLATFKEERYLHQTSVRPQADGEAFFYQDLPEALASAPTHGLTGEWRVHFHVPIYLERFGQLEGTRPAILQCLETLATHGDAPHFEVETYAWGVLPAELRQPDLAAGIARELEWLRGVQLGCEASGGR